MILESQDRGIYDFKIDPSKRYFKYKKATINLLAIVVAILICGITITSLINKTSNRTAVKVPHRNKSMGITVTTEESNTESTKKVEDKKNPEYGYITNELYDAAYLQYVDTEYNFYCAVPASYTACESIGSGNRIVLSSADTKTLLFIGAVSNKLNLSPEVLMKQYIAEFGDKVDYKDFGDSWYAVSKTSGNMYYYRKCFVEKEMILWFEFNVKSGSKEPIGTYIEYIEDNFKIVE